MTLQLFLYGTNREHFKLDLNSYGNLFSDCVNLALGIINLTGMQLTAHHVVFLNGVNASEQIIVPL